MQEKKPPVIEVVDNAEGMNSQKLKEALKYGTQTSMGEDVEATTSAEKGIGLKDALMAMENNWLLTIRDGLLNERNKHTDFTTGIGKEDAKVVDEERRKLGIPSNGTMVTGTLPEYFRERKFATVCERLQQHFLMRKLLHNPDYRIWAIDFWTKEKRLLEHKPPKVEKEALNEAFEVRYNGNSYKIHLLISKSSEALPQGKPIGESGLLFFYGKYSVVDFTFCRFEKDLSFSKFFGEVKMEVESIIKDPSESPLVDEKRRGLDPEHPFNKKLFDEINRRLMKIQEEEESSRYSFDEKTKRDTLRELNKISKEIKGKGPKPEPPIRPKTFAFHPPYVSIMEYEPRTVHLIINSSIVSDEFEITLQSTNASIRIDKKKRLLQKTIKFEREEKEEFVVRQIELYSEKSKINGEITATVTYDPSIPPAAIGVEVTENPMFSPTNGFAFVPDKTTIVDGGEKKVELYIEKSAIKSSKEITMNSLGPIVCPGTWLLPDPANLDKRVVKNVVKEEIPIKVRGTGFTGEKANIKASYEGKESILDIAVVPEPSFGGMFKDIRPSPKKTRKISDFLKDEGIVEIYYKHPLISKYMKRNFKSKPDFLVFISDTITREVIKAIVTSGIEESSSRFPIWDIEHPEKQIEEYVNNEYYEEGPKMHEMFMQLARTFKLGEEE